MNKFLYSSVLVGMLCATPAIYAQQRPAAADYAHDATYGRVKELTADKLVVDVDNAPDKSFDLKKEAVSLGQNLKVGDPVRLVGSKINGKTSWDVTRDDGSGVKHGDKTRSEELNSDTTYGRIKERTAAKLVVDVDNGPDKSFDLAKEPVKIGATLKVGDPVRIVEQKINGKESWNIVLDESNVKHGDKTREELRNK